MKHLKSYKVYETLGFSDALKAEISDILCELTDNGYETFIHRTGTTGSDCYLSLSPDDSIDVWIGKGTTRERSQVLHLLGMISNQQ